MLLTVAEVHNGQWNRIEHLLGTVIDALGVVAHNALVGPHVDPKKLRHTKAPKPIERPGARRKRRRATGAETAAYFARAKNPEGR